MKQIRESFDAAELREAKKLEERKSELEEIDRQHQKNVDRLDAYLAPLIRGRSRQTHQWSRTRSRTSKDCRKICTT